jgi:hypothetical protein
MLTHKSTSHSLPAAGRWWRFSRYEIRERVIRPTLEAKLEPYDPWARYRSSRSRTDEWVPPYVEFLNLSHQIGGAVDESERRILQWCDAYGLPGLLLQQTRMATLAPRWATLEEGTPLLVPSQLTFVRTNTGWNSKRTLFRPAELKVSAELKGQVVPHAQAPEAWARVGIVTQDLRSPDITHEGLRDTWSTFFPDVPSDRAEDYPYPAPLSAQFWREYAEPYSAFLDGLQCLAEALWELAHHKPEGQSTPADAQHVTRGVALLDALLASASPTIVPTAAGGFAPQWVCSSLLSAFAMMALQDKTEGRHVRNCASCGRVFISQHPAALYCSPHCRWKTQKRRSRATHESTASRKTRKRS